MSDSMSEAQFLVNNRLSPYCAPTQQGDKGDLSGCLYKGPDPIHEGSVLVTQSFVKRPHFQIHALGLGFNT